MVGCQTCVGCEPLGQQVPQTNLLWDISKNAELLLFWGCDQETTTWGWGGQLPSRLSYWWSELGIKQIYIAPDCNYAAAVHADKWIPILPNTDAALYLAIAHHWFANGTYDKAYLETHAHGVEEFEAYVMGTEDGIPKTPEWAAPITGVPARITKALAKEWASKRTTIVIGNGGPAIRGPYSHEPARLQALCLAMQGLGRPGCNQAKMIEWAFHSEAQFMSHPRPEINTNLTAAYTGGGRPSSTVSLCSLRRSSRRRSLRVRAAGTVIGTAQAVPETISSWNIITLLKVARRSTWCGPTRRLGSPVGTKAMISLGPCGTSPSSSSSPSIPGSRTIAFWPTSFCR